ncbi:MAG: hypothetical protein HFJ84_07885 [Clostridiales bacterium]|nr:hypothetical protein [Clostridiales bacterium]
MNKIKKQWGIQFVTKLENAIAGCHIPELDWTYQQGFQDWITPLQWVGLLPNSTETLSSEKWKTTLDKRRNL